MTSAADAGTVTGTRYTATRPRGLAEWRPQRATAALIASVSAVLVEYRDYLPLTNRQVYYRLVGLEVLGKTERDYSRLCEGLNRARRAGLIEWDAIRDDGGNADLPEGFYGVENFLAVVRNSATNYRRRFEPSTELWCEASGMLPLLASVARRYRVPTHASGGFDSVTAKHAAALRMIAATEGHDGAAVTVLHVGDYDASGLALIDSAADDIARFCTDYGKPGIVRFVRLAVTPEQIEAHGLPTAPPKSTDNRGDGLSGTVQCEALPPDVLTSIVDGALRQAVDLAALADHEQVEAVERTAILERLSAGDDDR